MKKMLTVVAVMSVLMLMLPMAVWAAESAIGLRLKLGSVAGVDHAEIDTDSGPVNPKSSTNAQVEGIYHIPYSLNPSLEVLVGGGLFSRKHSGSYYIGVGYGDTTFEYNAAGVSVTVGGGLKVNNNLSFELRLENAVGIGKPTLSTSDVPWNETSSGVYQAISLIVGGYYTIAKPGLELGVELASQSFVGKGSIATNTGGSYDMKYEGSATTANLVLGYRF